jgi:hypothetical protein
MRLNPIASFSAGRLFGPCRIAAFLKERKTLPNTPERTMYMTPKKAMQAARPKVLNSVRDHFSRA